MPDIDRFMDDVVADLRRRLLLLDDGGDRRAIEDGIALLTWQRQGGMDEARFELLLASLREGRAPAGRAVLKPRLVAAELARCWAQYTEDGAAALN